MTKIPDKLDVGYMRDESIVTMRRRMPSFDVGPSTSLFHIMEAAYLIWGCILEGSESPDEVMAVIDETLDLDLTEGLNPPPNRQAEFYKRREDSQGNKIARPPRPPIEETNVTDLPTENLVKELRDYFAECYQRRLPKASPEPDTSLYAIMGATAVVWAAFVKAQGQETLDLIRATIEQDRIAPLIPAPHSEPDFYEPLVDENDQETTRGFKERKRREKLKTQRRSKAGGGLPAGTPQGTGCDL